jgi:hypothetical protein
LGKNSSGLTDIEFQEVSSAPAICRLQKTAVVRRFNGPEGYDIINMKKIPTAVNYINNNNKNVAVVLCKTFLLYFPNFNDTAVTW